MPDEKEDKSLVKTGEDGRMDLRQPIEGDLYGYADQIKPEDSMAAFDEEQHRAELRRDTDGLKWRPHLIKVNHPSGTFDLSDLGLSDFSPNELKIQVIDHSPNRALWRIGQAKEDQMPLCSSNDAITGSMSMPDGNLISCEKCVYGRWWDPAQLLKLANDKGPKSAYAGVVAYINKQLKRFDSEASIEQRLKDKPGVNLPPPCKESRRIFAFIYDSFGKGALNQPVVWLIPPTSIRNWDKFRQDLSLMKIFVDRKPYPITLIGAITTMSLEKKQVGTQTYSLFNFAYDKIAAAKMRQMCLQIREQFSEEVMNFQVQMSDFDFDTGQDPTNLLPESTETVESVDLPDTIVLPDLPEGDELLS